ncbi:MAG: RelA/SpoT domain-containing protein [Proteobacteria bacterium]|nr:RelA/SpoT domain-containing protein [Pseudomonadota bacterium]
MSSLDFIQEENSFIEYYDRNIDLLNDAKDSFLSIVNTLLTQSKNVNLTKIEGRIKDREESVRKFQLKYQKKLEADNQEYEIKDHITDLIGLRAVCLYEDDVENAAKILEEHFQVIDVTDKISAIESTEDSFGYKGLHMDLRLNEDRGGLPEYSPYSSFQFEIQIRTIIQDSWSVLDHKIKYKKSIPNKLKRRINTLSALFELADREFKEIRDSTTELETRAIRDGAVDPLANEEEGTLQVDETSASQKGLNVFNFLKVASHFFRDYEFESYKVDGFVQELLLLKPDFEKGLLHQSIIRSRGRVLAYRDYLSSKTGKDKFNPFTTIRHCLYLSDKEIFRSALTNVVRENFDAWLLESV